MIGNNQIVDIEHKNAYSEILEILKYVSEEDYKKIPKEKINIFQKYSNKDNTFKYNPDKTLDEQNVSKIAKVIIGILFRDYWATDEQRSLIQQKQNLDAKILEEKNRQKYDINNIFEKRKFRSETKNLNNELPIENKKDSFFKKIITLIKNTFKKN